MKKTVKIISIILIVLLIICNMSNVALAETKSGTGQQHSSDETITPGNITGTKSDGMNTTEIVQVGNNIVFVIRLLGTIISVGVLVVLGIKYMTSSPEGKADFKSTMIPYLVGAVLVFAATWIASAIYGFASGIGQK